MTDIDITKQGVHSPYRRKEPSAEYIGVSVPKFDIMRKADATFPKPVRLPGRILLWDIRELAAWVESRKG